MLPKPSESRRRLWLMRLCAMVFIPLFILGALELGLRLLGYGYDTSFFSRVKIGGHDYFVPNEDFSYRFFPPAIARKTLPFRFAAEKATNSYRIFLFGESAAMGDPEPTYGFGRYLEVLLRKRYPGIHFQVICVALTAIDSNTILPIVRECARHQGDLWIIYMGNNEMVGPFGAETSYGFHAPNRGLIRLILAIKSTRVGQLLDALIRNLNSSTPRRWAGMEMFANNRLGYMDPARLQSYENFRGNLQDILHIAQRADVPVILSTVAVNLKDCAPFASMHSAGLGQNQVAEWNKSYEQGVKLEDAGSFREALALYQKAAGIDPQFADLEFRMGSCDLALTNHESARKEFELARDYDGLDFRADARINSIIKEAASSHAGQNVHLVDMADGLAQKSPDGVPGFNLFYEHVHLNFNGNYVFALEFADQTRKLLPRSITVRDRGSWASARQCDDALAITARDRLSVWQRILSTVMLPPFTGQFNHSASLKFYETKLDEVRSMINSQSPGEARQIYEQALASAPDDVFLRLNFVAFLETEGYPAQAIAEAKRCCELLPWVPVIHYHTATLLIQGGKSAEAVQYLARAIALRGNYVEAMNEMGEILANQQQSLQAIDWFERAMRSDPHRADTYINLGFLQQNQGDASAAMKNYQDAAVLEPDGPADYFNRANVAASAYQWGDVIEYLTRAVDARPQFWQARYQLGIQLAAKGESAAAQKQFLEVNHYRPDFFPAHLFRGAALVVEGKTNEALTEFRAVLRLDPGNESAQQQIQLITTSLPKGRPN